MATLSQTPQALHRPLVADKGCGQRLGAEKIDGRSGNRPIREADMGATSHNFQRSKPVASLVSGAQYRNIFSL